jgi:CheY-like chemotaxis protein/HPt (histidine-containing phosphotransfer) domain-containing protein
VVQAQLRKLGFEASAVFNGAEAVEAVQHEAYDLILMDCEMPVMDGFEATRRIRESPHAGIPILAVTAHAMPSDRELCLQAGMNDYLSKPVELSELTEKLDKWLPATGGDAMGQSRDEQTQPIFDADALLRRLMGDRQLAGDVLKGFLRDVPFQLNNLRGLVGGADAPGIRSQAHTLRGAAATVAAESLRAIAQAMEQAGTTGRMDHCGELLPRAVEEFERFKQTVERTAWV